MRTPRAGREGFAIGLALFAAGLTGLPGARASSQIPFEQAEKDLASPDARMRLHTVQMLKEAAYPQAAVPIARLIGDPQDAVQLEAIAAELNIFAAEKIVPRKRVGFVVEVRTPLVAEATFSSGPLAIGPLPVPAEVLTALRAGAHDDNPRVGLESLYAFGALAVEPRGAARREMLRASGPDLAALIGAPDAAMRYAALRVLGRLFAQRAQDDPIDATIGDAVIAGLNDRDRAVKQVAIEALGAIRYERAVQALTELFQYYGKGAVAEASLGALSRIAYSGSASLFTAQLTAKSAALRGIAVEGLARLGDRARLPDIQTTLGGERDDAVSLAEAFATVMLSNGQVDRITEALTKPKLRNQAKQYLIEIAPGRTSLLSRQLQDPEPRIRLDVVDALGLAGDLAALAMIEPLKNDRDPQVARAAEGALARLQRH
jgi:HEAT repeat protein